jgi:hypothetical protein
MSESLIIYDPSKNGVMWADSAENLKVSALNGCALIGAVKNQEQNDEAVGAMRDVKALLNMVEKARKETKEPFLEACRVIDAQAAAFIEPLKAEQLRVNTAVGNYQQEVQAEARRVEQQRQADLRRIEEARIAEQRRLEEEARKVREAAEDEARRIAEEQRRLKDAAKAAKTAAERKRLAEDQKTLQSDFEAAEAKRKAEEARLKAEQARQDGLAAQAREAVGPQAVIAKAKGQVAKPVWSWEVTDVWKLVRMHPGLVRVEPNKEEIRAAIDSGVREIHGLRIFEEVKSYVKATGQTKAIDV